MKKKTLGSAKRFGTRYGNSLKVKVANVERIQRSLQKCPHCKKVAVKRTSKGIFTCKSCGAVIAGKAYSIQ